VRGWAPRPSERSAASQSKPCAHQTSAPDYHPGRSKGHRHALEAYATEAYENELMKTRRIKTKRFWLEIVVLAAGTACALGLLLACLGAVAAVASEHQPAQPSAPPIQEGQPQSQEAQQQGHQAPQRTYTGMVTCSQCGARHPAAYAKTAAGCTRACVHSGAQFALVEGEKTYLLNGDLASLKKLAGQRATIVGAMSGNTITISSAAAAI
jgi:hypothetical protein